MKNGDNGTYADIVTSAVVKLRRMDDGSIGLVSAYPTKLP